mgnify:CR=1 FL=1
MNFGEYKPGNSAGTGMLGNGTNYPSPGSYSAGIPMEQAQEVFNPPFVAKSEYKDVTTSRTVIDPDTGLPVTTTVTTPTLFPTIGPGGQPVYVPSADPSADPTLVPRYDKNGRGRIERFRNSK